MLYQLRHQFENGEIGYTYQFELDDNLAKSEMYAQAEKHIRAAETECALPFNATWLLCGEQSKHFRWTH